MRIPWKPWLLLVAALAVSLTVPVRAAEPPPPPAAAPTAPTAKPPAPPATAEQMQGVSFEGLSEEQKKFAVSLLNEIPCGCGCGMTVAVCRRDDAKCTRSLALAKQVLDLVKQGKAKDEIVKAVAAPSAPQKLVQFPLPVGNSPSVGPAEAKVSILYYLDYQ